MLDKDLFRLLDDKKDIVKVIMVSVLGLLTNIGITACICWVIGLAYAGKRIYPSGGLNRSRYSSQAVF